MHLKKSISKTALLASLFLSISALSFSQNDSIAYPSLLWEISGNGLEEPSYLYGTMHVSSKVAFHLGREFLDAIESTDMLALELNPENWMEDIQTSELYDANYELSNYNNNGNGLYLKAFKIDPPSNKEIGQHLQTDDALVNQLLYRANNFESDYEEKTYLDLYLFQTAKKLGKEIFSLEDYDEVESLTVKAMLPSENEDEEEIRKKTRKLYSSGINIHDQLEDAYRTGNLDMVDSLSQMSNAMPGFQKYMVVERNNTMANQMDSLMRKKRLFTGVGAAHLPGAEGVIELLRNKGYDLNPIERSIGGKNKELEKKIDKQVYPVQFRSHTVADGSFKADTPGAFYELTSSPNAKIYMYPEMVNGTYFWVKRIQTYARINGQDEAHMKKRLDSLLYENIPGEIIRQKEIEKNGFFGYDITNVTSKSNTQRYQIFILPNELMIFKMGGTDDYVDKYGKQFFNTIELFPSDFVGWENFSPATGQFKVDLPGYPMEMNVSGGFFHMGHREVHSYDYQKTQGYFVFQTFLNDITYLEEDSYELWELMRSMKEDLNLDTTDSMLVDLNGNQALRFSMKSGQDESLEGMLIKRGPAYYLLASVGNDQDGTERFMESFEFSKPVYARKGNLQTTSTYTDTSLHFSVSTICNELGQQLQGMGDRMSYLYGISDEKSEQFEGSVQERIFNYPETGDMVVLEYVKYHKFAEFYDVDSLFDFNVNLLVDTGSVLQTEIKVGVRDGFNQRRVLITDTATTSAIMYEMFQRQGQFFGITTSFDTVQGMSPYQEEFFRTFAPSDRSVGIDPFGEKGGLFLEQLMSGDSILVHEALKSFSLATMGEKDIPQLHKAIRTFDFGSVDHDTYGQFEQNNLIDELGKFDSDENRDIIKEVYLKNDENIYLQLSCLGALGQHASKESFALLVDLMLESPPPVDDAYELWGVYRPLEAKMKLSKPLLKKLFVLNSIEEYRQKNYWLLSHMFRDGVVSPSDYVNIKQELFIHGKSELRKNFAKEGSKASLEDFYDYNGEAQTNWDLIRMIELLLPWKSEEKVNALVEKLKTTKNPRLRIDVMKMLLRNDIDPGWEFIEEQAKDLSNYAYLYKVLEELDRLDFAPKGYFNHRDMGHADLIGYPVSRNDSIHYVKEAQIETLRGPKKVYYYKVKAEESESDTWILYVSFFHSVNPNEMISDYLHSKRLGEIDDEDNTVEKQIAQQNETLSHADRPRYSARQTGSGNVYDFLYR